MKLPIIKIINTVLLALIVILLCRISLQIKSVQIKEPVKVISVGYADWRKAQTGKMLTSGRFTPYMRKTVNSIPASEQQKYLDAFSRFGACKPFPQESIDKNPELKGKCYEPGLENAALYYDYLRD